MVRGIADDVPALINAGPIQADTHRILTATPGQVEKVADELGLDYHTLRHQITRGTYLPLKTLSAAHYISRSKVLERLLLWPGLKAVTNQADFIEVSDDVEKELGDVSIAAAQLHAKVRAALANDGRIDLEEETEIRAAIQRAVDELAQVETLLDQKTAPIP